MWWLMVFAVPLIFGGIMCYNMSKGVPPPDRIWVRDERYGGLKHKKTG